MRNRAKCKKCDSIIESLHTHDYVRCTCGEIAIDGGEDYFRVMAKDYVNFLRIDDEGNEIVVKVIEKTEEEHEQNGESGQDLEPPKAIPKAELLEMLEKMSKNIENLPQSAMSLPITHYDHYSLLILLASILRA